jgi:dipeptidyl aminopeptidase/acylaminoacyl peptidase
MRSLLFCCALLLCSPLAAAEKRTMTAEDLWKIKRVGAPSIAPDGKWAAVDVTEYDLESGEPKSQIWLLSTDGKQQKQLTTAPGRSSGPKWSPDGKSIAFVSKRAGDEQPQVYVIAAEGGEARRVTNLPFAPASLKWSGDSSTIYFIAWTWPDANDDAAYKKREKEKKDAKSKAMIVDDALFRFWDKWLADGKRPFVFAVDVATGKHRNLMAGTGHNLPVTQPGSEHFDVSSDGKELCYVADNVKDFGLDVNLDLFTLRLEEESATPKCITEENTANDWFPRYSPDGKRIAFLRQKIKLFYADQARIMIHDRGNGKSKAFGLNTDHSVVGYNWYANSSRIEFDLELLGGIQTFSGTPIDGRFDVPEINSPGVSRLGDRSKDDRVSVSQAASFDEPPRIVASTTAKDGSPVAKDIDHFNDKLIAQWKLGKVENRTFKGADDRDVQMFIVYPPDFDPAKKWPLVQMVHGGPHNAFHNDFSFRWNPQLWAARGWVVAIVNFHGSSSFGQQFTDSITGDLGTKPMTDIMKSTDWFEQQPWIDKDRIAAAGASYGGYMMAWLNGHTDRFKAMVCHAGVYNWHSMLASDIVRGRERSLGAPPWSDLDKIDRQSPQRFAKNFKTPTLVTHGEQDFRVPVTQGLEYYNTLRQKGVPTRLVYFPDENHWVLKPHNSLLWHREAFAWLEKYIGHGPTETKKAE